MQPEMASINAPLAKDDGFGEGLATRFATVWHWRIMLAVAGTATVATVAALLAPQLSLPELPAVVSAYGTCIAIADLLTSYLLFIQFDRSRRAPQALLGAVYLYSGLIVGPHILFFPGVLPDSVAFGGGPQSAVWLWVFWHFGFLAFMVCFVAGDGFGDGPPLQAPTAARLKWGALAAPPLVVLGLTAMVTGNRRILPDLVRPTAAGNFVRLTHDFGGIGHSTLTTAGLLVGFGLVVTVPIMTRCRRVIDLGLAVAVYAMLLDTISNIAGNTRYSLGWYAARIDTVLSSCSVLAIYLNEITRLYLKVSDTNRDLAARTVELEAAREAAEAANRSKSAFLAAMSHEIRTPINAVLGLAHLLGGTRLDVEQHEFVDRIDAAGKALLSVIDNVLDFSRIEAGRLVLESVPFAMSEVIDRLIAVMSVAADAKEVELTVAVDRAVPRRLQGDMHRLLQVLNNLVGNGVKFTEAGKVAVDVRLAGRTENRVILTFMVTDTGIGVPAARLPTLFEAFVQGDSSTTRRYGGSGLGLTIAKRLVDLMGGSIDAESAVGRGSSFWCTIPFEVPSAVVGEAADVDRMAGQLKDGPALRAIRVLLVEDNSANEFITRRILERHGATVQAVGDGRQAVECLRAAPDRFDVVLMDVQMPVMDGYAATRMIRQDLGLTALPIIALTAGVLADERAMALDAGMTDFLGKPAGVAHTLRVLRRHLAATAGTSGG